MLRFEPVPFQDDADATYGAVIVTSANALRAIEPQLAGSRLLKLPLFAVGEHTAAAARDAGFGKVIAAEGDAGALRDLVLAQREGEEIEESEPAAVSRRRRSRARSRRRTRRRRFYGRDADDLPDGAALSSLPREVCDAFAANADRGRAALFAAQRARLPGGGARRRRRNLGAGACRNAAFRRPSPRSCARPARPRCMAAASPDENALFEALDACFAAADLALREPGRISGHSIGSASPDQPVREPQAMADDRPEGRWIAARCRPAEARAADHRSRGVRSVQRDRAAAAAQADEPRRGRAPSPHPNPSAGGTPVAAPPSPADFALDRSRRSPARSPPRW